MCLAALRLAPACITTADLARYQLQALSLAGESSGNLAFRDGVAQLIAAITEHSLHLAAAAATAAAAAATVGTNWRRCRLAATGYGSLSSPLCR